MKLKCIGAAIMAVFITAGSNAGELTLSSALGKNAYSQNEKIELAVELKNNGAEDLPILRIHPLLVYTIQIKAPNGKSAPLTLEGIKLMRTVGDVPGGSYAGMANPLKGGGTYSFSITDISRMYDLSLQGEYRIKVTAAIAVKGRDKSSPLEANELVFEIKAGDELVK